MRLKIAQGFFLRKWLLLISICFPDTTFVVISVTKIFHIILILKFEAMRLKNSPEIILVM